VCIAVPGMGRAMPSIEGLEQLIVELSEYQGPATPDIIEKVTLVGLMLAEVERRLQPIGDLVYSHLYPEEWSYK
jgi:hypothetical protein